MHINIYLNKQFVERSQLFFFKYESDSSALSSSR